MLEAGTVTWVGGRNGAGKTTMLRIAAGLIEPHHGTVTALGVDPRRHRGRYQRLVSFLPAGDRGLYARLSVRRQLEFCARISLLRRRADARGSRAGARRSSIWASSQSAASIACRWVSASAFASR